MTDNTTPRLTISFERKVSTGDYGSMTANVWLSADMPTGGNDAIAAKASELITVAKAAVYDELGIEVQLDEAGVLREVPKAALSVRTTPGTQAAGYAPPSSSGGSFNMKNLDVQGEMTQDVPDWLVELCAEYGITKVWANTGKYGQFYKEFVSKGAAPLGPVDHTGRPAILAKPKNDSF